MLAVFVIGDYCNPKRRVGIIADIKIRFGDTFGYRVDVGAGLKFTSLSKDGMANIDYIGWMSENLLVGKVDVGDTSTTPGDSGTTAIGVRDVRATRPARTADRYYVDCGTRGTSAGGDRMGGGKTVRVDGSSHAGAQR